MEPAAFTSTLGALLEQLQAVYLDDARAFRDANIVDVTSYEQLKEAVAQGERRRRRRGALESFRGSWG